MILSAASTALKPVQELNARLDVVNNILSVAGYPSEKIDKMSPDQRVALYKKDFQALLLDKNNEEASKEDLMDRLSVLGYKKEELEEKETFEVLDTFKTKLGLLAHRNHQKVAEYDPGYKLLFTYRPEDDKKIEAYIIPISGKGLWGDIYGYFALKPDLNTVEGIRFYKHQETPGLGGEIEKRWFNDQFVGKKIFSDSGEFKSITIVKGEAKLVCPGEEIQHCVDGISGATITGKSVNKFLSADLKEYLDYFKSIMKQNESSPGVDAESIMQSVKEKVEGVGL